jgi:hypothetical protein
VGEDEVRVDKGEGEKLLSVRPFAPLGSNTLSQKGASNNCGRQKGHQQQASLPSPWASLYPVVTMLRRPPTSVSVQESDVETLKAYRRAKMMQHNPNLSTSSFSSLRPDGSASINDHQPHHHHPSTLQRAQDESDDMDDPGTQPGLSQQENHNPNQPSNATATNT